MPFKSSLNYKIAKAIDNKFNFNTSSSPELGGAYWEHAIKEVTNQEGASKNTILQKASYTEDGETVTHLYHVAISKEGKPMTNKGNLIALPCPPHCPTGKADLGQE